MLRISSILIWLSICGVAEATFVVGNLREGDEDGVVSVSISEWQASSITISPDSVSWEVSSVTLALQEVIPNQNLSLSIVSESAFRPDSSEVFVRFTESDTVLPSDGLVTFQAIASGRRSLEPGQRYWLVLGVAALDDEQVPATGLFRWSFATHGGADSQSFPEWSLGAVTASSGAFGQNWEVSATTPFLFAIDARPLVPAMTLSRWLQMRGMGGIDETTFLANDLDGNGLTGLMDFAFDAKRDALPQLAFSADGRVTVSFRRWVNAPELNYQLESSLDLEQWDLSSGTEETRLLSHDVEVISSTYVIGTAQFHRVKVLSVE